MLEPLLVHPLQEFRSVRHLPGLLLSDRYGNRSPSHS